MNKFVDMENYAKENDVPIMEKEGILFIVDLIHKRKVKTILEIGSAIGYSAICMAECDKEIYIDTIERDEKRFHIAQENIKKYDKDKQINCVNMDAYLYKPNKEYDLIFIDAAKSQYQGFFDLFLPCLKKGGVVLVDNILFHGFVDHPERISNRNTRQLVGKIRRFRDEMLNREDLNVKYYDTVGDGVLLIEVK